MDPTEIIGRLITDARDSRRPEIDDVVAIMESAFGQMNIAVRAVVTGPVTWIWEDVEMTGLGFPRYYVLTATTSEGIEGYPVFTIRQAYSVRLDAWITMSSLVIGPGNEDIVRSISVTMAHHAGAFAGVKHVAGTIAANRSSPMAGMVAVQRLLNTPAEEISEESISEMVAEVISDLPSAAGKVVN